ncbi:MAG: NIPSNAP family containing protein, partial [Pedobacter sp.]
FKPIAIDTAEQLVYVFIPLKKLTDLNKVDEHIAKDKQYLEAGKSYLNAGYNDAPYTRVESIILKAFSAMPEYALPKLNTAKSERIYELRSYEAATENLSLNKIGMFNDAEVDIFTKLNFNAVFYGQVISGSKMPNLMYLTTFNNKADRDKHWSDFGPEYKKISGLPQYQHNVSKNVTLFLYPTDYSDF